MLRPIVVLLVACLAAGPVLAQTGQFPGVVPPTPSPFTPSPQLGGAPAPPQVLSAPTVSPGLSSRLVTTPRGRTVTVPSGPGHESFSDRVEHCVHAGTAAGVRANNIGAFTRQCAN